MKRTLKLCTFKYVISFNLRYSLFSARRTFPFFPDVITPPPHTSIGKYQRVVALSSLAFITLSPLIGSVYFYRFNLSHSIETPHNKAGGWGYQRR
jgi:hypothetical protein